MATTKPASLGFLCTVIYGHLVGYPSGTEYWHYVTGNGYQGYYYGAKYVRYFDPYNGIPGAFGQHQEPLYKWPALLRDRGIVH